MSGVEKFGDVGGSGGEKGSKGKEKLPLRAIPESDEEEIELLRRQLKELRMENSRLESRLSATPGAFGSTVDDVTVDAPLDAGSRGASHSPLSGEMLSSLASALHAASKAAPGASSVSERSRTLANLLSASPKFDGTGEVTLW